MTDLAFTSEPPPPSITEAAEMYDHLAAQLRAQPHKWAVIAIVPSRYQVGAYRAGLIRRGCSVVSRRQPDRTINIWAAYKGPV